MSILAGLSLDNEIKTQDPTIRGARSTGSYDGTIVGAAVIVAATGAQGISFEVALDAGGKYYGTEWIRSGTAKGNKSYYVDRNGDKQYIPGYVTATNILFATLGETTFDNVRIEQRGIADRDGKMVDTPVLVDLIGKRVALGLVEVRANKSVKNDAGKRVDTAEERVYNEIGSDAVFNIDTRKIRIEEERGLDAKFEAEWVRKNQGKRKDLYKEVKNAMAPPFAPGATSPEAAPAANIMGSAPTESSGGDSLL